MSYEFLEDGRRVIKTELRTVYLTKTDPNGFWKVTFKEGDTPKILRGMYTSPKSATNDVMGFINSEKTKIENKRPTPKFKKVKDAT